MTIARATHLRETDCVAGHVGLELRNVVANYPFESSRGFPGSEPNSGHRDLSRLSCGAGGHAARARCQHPAGVLAHTLVIDLHTRDGANWPAISADPKMIRRRQKPATSLRSLWKSPGLLTFAACLFLFQLANASALPLVVEDLVYQGEKRSGSVKINDPIWV